MMGLEIEYRDFKGNTVCFRCDQEYEIAELVDDSDYQYGIHCDCYGLFYDTQPLATGSGGIRLVIGG